jgi:hypothetical protein
MCPIAAPDDHKVGVFALDPPKLRSAVLPIKLADIRSFQPDLPEGDL